MANYQEMYAVLFRKITTVLEELQDIQRQTEEMYISCEPSSIIEVVPNKVEKTKLEGSQK